MTKLTNPRLLVFCAIALAMVVMLAFAKEKKEQPKKVAAHLLLKSGKEVELADVNGEDSLKLSWGSFELVLDYYDIQKCNFSGKPIVKNNTYNINAKVLLSNGIELTGRAIFPNFKSIEGNWDFGTRKVFWKELSSVTFRRTAGPPESVSKLFGTISDQKGKMIHMLSLPETQATQRINYVQNEIFGTKDRTKYFALPCGSGYIFLPFSDIVQIVGKEQTWEVKRRSGKKLSLVVVEGGAVQAITGRSNVGHFRLKVTQLGTLKFEHQAPSPDKPKSGLASKSIRRISGTISDHLGLTHKLEGIQFYYFVGHCGFWIPKRPSDYSRSSGHMLVKLPDGSEATIELASLRSISFKEGTLMNISSKTGKTIEAKLYDPYGRGTYMGDEGFVGVVVIGSDKYWGYFPINLIKAIQFE